MQGVSVITTSQLLSLPMLKQVVRISYIDQPIIADSRFIISIRRCVLCQKIAPALNVPEWIVAQREDINDNMLEKLGLDDDEA